MSDLGANWRLENLEPRVLLSSAAAILPSAHPAQAVHGPEPSAHVHELPPPGPGHAEGSAPASTDVSDVFAGLHRVPLAESAAQDNGVHAAAPTRAVVTLRPASNVRVQAVENLTLELGPGIKLTGTYTQTGDGSEGNPLAVVDNMKVEFTGPLAGMQTTTTISGLKLFAGAAEIASTTLAVTGAPGNATLYSLSGGEAVLKALRITFQNDAGNRTGFAVVGDTSDLLVLKAPKLAVGGVTLSGESMTIGVVDGKFKAAVPDSAPLEFSIGSIVKVKFSGSISSESVDLNGTATLSIGNNDVVGLGGTMTVKFANDNGIKFAATVDGGLYVLGQAVATINGSLAITATTDSFKFGLKIKFDVAKGAVKVDVACTVEVTPTGMNVAWDGAATLFGRWNFNSTGFVNSNGTWAVNGKFEIKQSIGNSFLGGSVSAFVEVRVTNTEWSVTLGGAAEGHLGPLRAEISATAKIDSEGTFSLTFKVRILFWDKEFTLNVSIKDGLKIWSSELDGSVLFIDRNGDGIAQKDELGGKADDDGDFAFQDTKLMEEFDINGDKKLQRAEIEEFFDTFEAYDKNKDGYLSKVEAKDLIGNFGAMDLDGDNELTPKEVPFLSEAQFAQYDTDKNGSLDDAETPFISDFAFFDKNGDGQWDPTETAPFLPSLATFDKNHDGELDGEEADDFFGWYLADDGNDPLDRVITVTGGRDKATGMDNPLILRALGGDYGEMAKVTPSPFSTLEVGIVEVGLDRVDAQRFIAEGLDLPPTVDPNTMDPNTLVGPLAPQGNTLMARAEQLTTVVVNGAALLQAVNPSLTTFQAQQAMWHGLAIGLYFTKVDRHPGLTKDELSQYNLPDWDMTTTESDDSGEITSLPGGGSLSLADAGIVAHVIQDAADEIGVNLTSAQVEAYSRITSEMNGLINGIASAGVDVKAKLSHTKAVTQNQTASAMRQMGAGIMGAPEAADRYTGANLAAAIAAMQGPVSGPPVISPLANHAIQTGAPLSVPFDVANVLGKASALAFAVTSSNPELVPQDRLAISGDGQLRTLTIQPLEGRTGFSTITVTATENGKSSSRSFQVGTAAQITAWSSVAKHGPALGDLALAIGTDGKFTESRGAGVSKLVVQFDAPIDAASLSADSVVLAGVAGPDSAPLDLGNIKASLGLGGDGTSVSISFSQSLPDATRFRIRLAGVKDVFGNAVSANAERLFTTLAGDANGDGVVNNTDVGGVKSLRSADPLRPATLFAIRSDIDLSGGVTGSDVAEVYRYRGHDARFLQDPVLLGPNGLVAGQFFSTGAEATFSTGFFAVTPALLEAHAEAGSALDLVSLNP